MKPTLQQLQNSKLFNPPINDWQEGYNDGRQGNPKQKTTAEYTDGYGVGWLDHLSS